MSTIVTISTNNGAQSLNHLSIEAMCNIGIALSITLYTITWKTYIYNESVAPMRDMKLGSSGFPKTNAKNIAIDSKHVEMYTSPKPVPISFKSNISQIDTTHNRGIAKLRTKRK